ncbi:MAG: glycoside hydrolase family 32 protein [Clostridia bacterium]|nr:glycoside hydrolase family 32 protein [Clostridia bacterium]
MSTWAKRNFRPALHYAPPYGWINDPNGLVYADGEYHLFAQYYPYDTVWGPMHWFHAKSKDLLHWKQLGVALRPDDELGMIFSGSAVIDEGNTSGLGDGTRDPMILMFTHHGDCEQQSIAYSTDYIHFTKYEGNPVIKNPGLKDFRDPKVFKNPVKGGWSCAVAAGDHVEFYASKNLIDWEKTGEFGKSECIRPGVYECPDVFPLTAPDGKEYWVLTCSNCYPNEEGGNRSQYFIGRFDGDTFHQTEKWNEPVMADVGYDNYAAVTFAGADRPVQIGWGTSWVYAKELPTSEFCGQMTIAREMYLADTPAGLRMASRPVLPNVVFGPVEDGAMLPGEVFALRIRAKGAFEAKLENDGESFRFGLDEDGNLFADRTNAGMSDFHPQFNDDMMRVVKAKKLCEGAVEMTVVFDTCMAELFADNGVYSNTTLVFPQKRYQRLRLTGAEAELAQLA